MKIQELEVGKLYKQCKNEMDIYKINKSGYLFVKPDGVPNNYFHESCLSYNSLIELDFEEYETPIKWEDVPVDTKVLIRDSVEFDWTPRHFSEYKDGKVYCFIDGRTSFTSKSNTMFWKYCKLFKEETK